METAEWETWITAVYKRPAFYDKSDKLYSNRVHIYLNILINIYQYILKFEALNGDTLQTFDVVYKWDEPK